jgi:hypothetical protein
MALKLTKVFVPPVISISIFIQEKSKLEKGRNRNKDCITRKGLFGSLPKRHD